MRGFMHARALGYAECF